VSLLPRLRRIVERGEFAITKAALQRARWRCEVCGDDSDLRVVETTGGALFVLCGPCRLRAPWAPSVNSFRATKSGRRMDTKIEGVPNGEGPTPPETEQPSPENGDRSSAVRVHGKDEPDEPAEGSG
jgi:hypothetical protein